MFQALALALGIVAPTVSALAGEPAMFLRPVAPVTLAAELRPTVSPDNPPLPRAVRNVTPQDMTAPPAVTGPVVRIAPAPSAVPPPLPAKLPTARLHRPLVTSAGALRADGRDIRLAGIVAPGFEERCGEGAASWPCGRMARAALARLIRGRAVECVLPEGAEAIPDPADCRVARQSLSAWLVAQGWARATDPAYADAEARARASLLGIWAGERPGGTPLPAAQAASAPERALAIKARVSGTP
jgi:endonuclease YncB( thermonuclease family)